MAPDEKERKVTEEELEEHLGRPLQSEERGVLEVLNTVLAQEREGGAVRTPPPAQDGGDLAAGATQRLLDALRTATQLAEILAASDRPRPGELQGVLKRLTPQLQAIAHAANELLDLSLGDRPAEPERPE